MQLEWMTSALEDREAIFDYLWAHSRKAARSFDHNIESQVDRLLYSPESGRIGRVARTRELVVNRTPYVAAYVILGDIVRILRVLHGAQEWPNEIDKGNR